MSSDSQEQQQRNIQKLAHAIHERQRRVQNHQQDEVACFLCEAAATTTMFADLDSLFAHYSETHGVRLVDHFNIIDVDAFFTYLRRRVVVVDAGTSSTAAFKCPSCSESFRAIGEFNGHMRRDDDDEVDGQGGNANSHERNCNRWDPFHIPELDAYCCIVNTMGRHAATTTTATANNAKADSESERGDDDDDADAFEDVASNSSQEDDEDGDDLCECLCLFCPALLHGRAATYAHLQEKHGFDFQAQLLQPVKDEYDRVRVVNFVRHCLSRSLQCPHCSVSSGASQSDGEGQAFASREELVKHIEEKRHHVPPLDKIPGEDAWLVPRVNCDGLIQLAMEVTDENTENEQKYPDVRTVAELVEEQHYSKSAAELIKERKHKK